MGTGVARLPCPDCKGEGQGWVYLGHGDMCVDDCRRCGGSGDVYEYTEDELRHYLADRLAKLDPEQLAAIEAILQGD